MLKFDHVLGFTIGALLALVAYLLGVDPGHVLAATFGVLGLCVITPCVIAPLLPGYPTPQAPGPKPRP